MLKHLLYTLTAITLFTACSSNEELAEPAVTRPVQQQEAVAFEPYMARTTRVSSSRSGSESYQTRATEITDLTSLKAPGKGFGVFAYEQGTTDIETYNQDRIDPNFMFNQQVTWNPTTLFWEYDPVKYWPNNYGTKLSFFAYTPYHADIKRISGSPRIILERGNYGPAIYYNTLVDNLDKALDLCWGANATTDITGHILDPDHAPVDYVKNGGSEHVSITSQIKFNFKHALTRLKFNVQIFNDILTDGGHHGTPPDGGSIDVNTRIEIKSLKLIGFTASDGILSLYDGTWNAQFETGGIDLLPYLVKTDFQNTDAAQEYDLFGAGKYLTIIPNAHFKIKIEYWVITTDPTPGAHPLNSTVTKNIIESPLEYTAEQGKAYEYHLNLGMTTVKFDAVVTDWINNGDIDIDLPNNHN